MHLSNANKEMGLFSILGVIEIQQVTLALVSASNPNYLVLFLPAVLVLHLTLIHTPVRRKILTAKGKMVIS